MIGARTTGTLNRIRLTTGGSGYSSRPAVTISGGGGTGAVAVAHMSGESVESVQIVNAGTGYTSDPTVTIAGNAEAVATAYTGQLVPASFVRNRFNNVFVFDGMGRGLRWDGETATMQAIGLQKPAVGPTLAASTAAGGKYVERVEVVSGGSGYVTPPTVTLSGGSATTNASVRALVFDGVVTAFDVREPGAGYQEQPELSVSGGRGDSANLTVNVNGSVDGFDILNSGKTYGDATLNVTKANGLTDFNADVTISSGVVFDVAVLSPGSGATSDPEFVVESLSGNFAVVSPRMSYKVESVNVADGGAGFHVPPTIRFVPDPLDTRASAASATASVANGTITAVTVLSGGEYSIPPTVEVGEDSAVGRVVLADALSGRYQCAMRYIDATPEDLGGPMPSSISELKEIDLPSGASGIVWTLGHPQIDDRVSAVELWRGTADQEVILFRVATIQRTDPEFTGEYIDSINDTDLIDPDREDYAVMPIVLPSGQVNARRFEVPPGHYSVAATFQDRIWLAVDATGRSPNSLRFSEIDEPESFPVTNELILQESTADTDSIVALAPLGSMLLVVQTRHLYKLQYVSQPIIDASILLAAYRGIINSRCWGVMGGVAYLADYYGIYAFDGNSVEPASVPIDNYWADQIIDFSKSEKFFLKTDPATKTVRFFYCESGDSEPVRCLCYCTATKAWWTEDFAFALTAASEGKTGDLYHSAYGSQSGAIYRSDGYSDNGSAVNYSLKTGSFPLSPDDSRGIGLVYTPTAADAELTLRLFYNGSSTSRDNAISSDRGDGFEARQEGAVLNMNVSRSHLQDSNGFARAMYSGRMDPKSSGGDRHIAVEVSGSQSTVGQAAAIHALAIEGVG